MLKNVRHRTCHFRLHVFHWLFIARQLHVGDGGIHIVALWSFIFSVMPMEDHGRNKDEIKLRKGNDMSSLDTFRSQRKQSICKYIQT